jgi:hypothetical protein
MEIGQKVIHTIKESFKNERQPDRAKEVQFEAVIVEKKNKTYVIEFKNGIRKVVKPETLSPMVSDDPLGEVP